MATPLNQTPAPAAGDKLIELKEKIKEYIEDLEDLTHEYEDEDFAPDDLPAALDDVSIKVSNADLAESEQEVIQPLSDVLDEQVKLALVHSKALGEAYRHNNVRSMLMNSIELYVKLIEIGALLDYVSKYVGVEDYVEDLFEEFIQKTRSVIGILAKYVADQGVELDEDDAETIHDNTVYYHDLAENWHDVDEGLGNLEEKLADESELKRGTYWAVEKALNLMWKYYDIALPYGVGAEEIAHGAYDDEEDTFKPEDLDIEALLLNIADTYAYFSAMRKLYDSIVSDYVTDDDFEDAVDRAIGRAKDVINIILSGYDNT
ncbi:MAG: hypothetical protein QW430_12380 [Metallosphaera sp.]|uniref:hypothetical protein n=1 Tax=Metallosphaera sp. TaxID=2020860 RepID=UPI0031628FD9